MNIKEYYNIIHNMKEYECQCCQFKTNLGANFARHNASPKHLANIKKSEPVADDSTPSLKDTNEAVEFLFCEISTLKEALQECKKMIMDISNRSTTQASEGKADPHTIIIQQALPAVTKQEDETCNPRYIEKQLNDDPARDNTPNIVEYFSIKKPCIEFNFDELDSVSDVAERGKSFVIETMVDYVKKKIKDNGGLPFVYIKSSWYVKSEKNGWEKTETANNKGRQGDHKDYVHNVIVKSFIFIIHNKCIQHFDEINGGTEWRMHHDAMRLLAEVFKREGFTNKDLLKPLGELF